MRRLSSHRRLRGRSQLVLIVIAALVTRARTGSAQRLEDIRAAVGSRVRVDLRNSSTRVIGRLDSVRDSTLAIESPTGTQVVVLGEIRRLDLSLGPDRLGDGAYGFAIGLVVGTASGYAIGKREEKRHPGEFADWKSITGGVEGGLLGAVLGAAVGALAAREEWYRVR